MAWKKTKENQMTTNRRVAYFKHFRCLDDPGLILAIAEEGYEVL